MILKAILKLYPIGLMAPTGRGWRGGKEFGSGLVVESYEPRLLFMDKSRLSTGQTP